MKHSTFKRILCLVLAFCLILPYCVNGVHAAEEIVTRIPHTQTEGDSNYFTYSTSGWSAMGQSDEHVWSDDPSADPSAVWYTVNFVGHAIDIYAGKNWPMGYVAYYIDDEYVGEYNLYQSYNSNSLFITKIDGLDEGEHVFKAVATGKNGLTSGSTNDLIDCAEVYVYHEPYAAQSIIMEESNITLGEGGTKQLRFTAVPSYATPTDLVYTSSDEDVATVSDTGLVTAVAPGSATITLTSGISNLSVEVSVTVTPVVPGIAGSIVDTDSQWTQNRYNEVKSMANLSADLTAWRNDVATSELALVSVDSALKNVAVTASDFVSGENTIPASAVTATFIRSTQAYNKGYIWGSYPYPDGTNRSESSDILWSTEPMDIGYNAVQPVWVEIAVPRDAEPGTYTGTLTVTADGLEEPMTFTYTLKVQDVVLPDATEFANGFDVELWQYPYSSAEYYGLEPFSEEHLDAMRSSMEIYKSIGGHAITTTIQEEAWSGQTYSQNDIHYPSMIRWEKVGGVMTYDYTDFDAWVSFCKELGIGDKIVLYSIAPWHNTITYWENGVLKSEPNTFGNIVPDAMWTHFLTDLIAHLEEKGWFDDAYIGIDERGFSTAAFDLIDSIKNSKGESLKTAGAMDGFVNKWDLALRVTDLNVGDTAVHDHPTQFAQLLAERTAKGYRTTLYSCTGHQPGNFSLCAPVESYWVILNAGKQGGAGFLRWAYDAWVADPLNDTTHSNFEAGDCFLIFPDEKDAADPVSRRSVRLARIAEGVRDINKLMYIEKNAPALTGDVDAVYNNVTDLLGSYGAYTCPDVTVVANEAAAFKSALNTLTDRYILLLDGATADVDSVTILDGDSVKVELGGTKQLSVEVLPSNLLDNSVTWSSSDENIVTVADGLLTGVGQGTATVTATSVADPSKSDTIEVVVDLMGVDQSKQASYYSFDNVSGSTVADDWAEYDATLKDGATIAAGMSGNALSVNSAGVGAIVNDNRELSDWTVAYWVKTTANFTSEISVMEDADQKYSLSLRLAADRADPGFRVGDNSGDVLSYRTISFQPNTWYHIAWVRDYDADLKLYVNGVYKEANTWTGLAANRDKVKSPIDVIGGTGFTGLIDEVKIYNAPLTEAEIASAMMLDGVNLSDTAITLDAGDTYQIRTTVISFDPDKSVTYVSANPGVATVTDKGLVTGVGRGETVITVTNPATGYSAELAVKVNKAVNIRNVLPRYVMPEKYLSTIERAPGTDRQYLGQPDMIQTKTGRLITAYPVGHGKGPLVMRISEDGGVTWTEKTDLPASWAGSQETPTLYTVTVGGNERLLLITACPGWGTDSAGNQYGFNVSYSDDNGDTWSEYEHFYSYFSDGDANDAIVAMASLVQLRDENGNYIEKWMGVFHNYSYVNYKTYLTFDEAGNMQWSEPVPFLSEHRSIESSHQMCEIGMFRSPDGSRIIGLARSQSHMHLSTMIYSDDEGETWSEPVELPGSLAGERHKAQYDPETGKLVITFREIWYDKNGDGAIASGDWICGDWGLWVGTYEDLMNLNDGEYCVTIDEDFTQNTYSGDTGYAGFVVLPDGTFVMNSYGHWDEDFSKSWTGGVTTDLCYIRQARFKLEELENVLFGDPCVDGHTEKVVPGTEPTFDAPGLTEGKVCELCGEVIVAQETIPALDYNEGIVPLEVLHVSCGDYEPDGGDAEGPAELAVDNDLNTIWHTDWYGTSRDNHWIQFEITEDYAVDGLRYKPRITGNTNGIITQYDILVSNDGVTFESVAAGNWAGDRNWKVVEFDAQNVKYVRLLAVDAITDNSWVFACAAEVRLTGEKAEAPHEHTPAEAVRENEVPADCVNAGSYDSVVYCATCGEEISRQTVTVDALGHDFVDGKCTRCGEEQEQPVTNPFTDVPEDSFYYEPVLWAVENGITTGSTATTFNPNGISMRGQIVTFLWRAAGSPEPETTENPFVDVKESDYFYKAVLW
ncbi:MAG: Ig-like domain-containing protein, partial [Oscillospiraceae bacterium]|nr:Ig-like domain-containing protein [Oscillospiraceae bacterium]